MRNAKSMHQPQENCWRAGLKRYSYCITKHIQISGNQLSPWGTPGNRRYKAKFKKESVVASYGEGGREILQVLSRMSTRISLRPSRAIEIHYTTGRALAWPSHRSSRTTSIWTLNSRCCGLIQPLLWVYNHDVNRHKESNRQPGGNLQPPWPNSDHQVRQWSTIPLRRISGIL